MKSIIDDSVIAHVMFAKMSRHTKVFDKTK